MQIWHWDVLLTKLKPNLKTILLTTKTKKFQKTTYKTKTVKMYVGFGLIYKKFKITYNIQFVIPTKIYLNIFYKCISNIYLT